MYAPVCAPQVRALAYTNVLTRGIMSSMHDLESGIADAIGQPLQQALEAIPAGMPGKAHADAARVTAPEGDMEAPALSSDAVQHSGNASGNFHGRHA